MRYLNESNKNQLRKSIVQNNDFLVKKRFSQNFLLDENIIRKIVESAELNSKIGVIEIGPGLGALTKEIVKVAKQTLLYEIDRDLVPHLHEFFKEYKNLRILNKDILKSDVNKDIEEFFVDIDKIVVISNLPYHITTPIIMKFLEEVNDVDLMILMMQLEVAKRITSKPDTKDYNALSVIIQHQAKAKYLFKVPKSVFHPQPKVDSAVIKLEIFKNLKNSENKSFYEFVHACFTQRRKTLVNNLFSNYDYYTKTELGELLEKLNININTRAETLELNDFVNLYETYFKNI